MDKVHILRPLWPMAWFMQQADFPCIGLLCFPAPLGQESFLQDIVQVAAFSSIVPESVFLGYIVPFQQLIQRPFHGTFRQDNPFTDSLYRRETGIAFSHIKTPFYVFQSLYTFFVDLGKSFKSGMPP